MLELYHWEPTSNSGEVLILLHEKGLDFVGRYVDVLGFEHLRPEFLKVNPQAQVPVLVHDGKVLTETGFILQYLEASFPTPSFTPATARERYWVNVWIKYVNEYLAPAAWRLGAHQRMATQMNGRSAAAVREGLARAPVERRQAWEGVLKWELSDQDLEIVRGLLPTRVEHMEAALSVHEWLAGETYSIADIATFPTVRSLPALVPDLINDEATPAISAWIAGMEARPAVQSALALARTGHPERVFAPGPEGSRWG